jgi:hypothetical protein
MHRTVIILLSIIFSGIFFLAGCGTVKDLTEETAAVETAQYKLSIGVVGNGTVTVSPNLINSTYPAGTTITIIPIADSGWAFFNNWQGDATSNYYTINKNSAVTVNFTQLS